MDNIYDVIRSIDDINQITNESDLGVLNALYDSYEKSSIILENYEGDDLSSFSIFQEGEILDKVRKEGKDDSAFMRIILFIPRIIRAMVKSIGKTVEDHPIKDIVSKADKSKKEPGLLKKIMTSKPVKTISFVTSTAAVIEVGNTFNHLKDQITEISKSSKSIDELVVKRKELLESFKPTCTLDINKDDKLTVCANCNLSGFDNVFNIYKRDIDKMIRRRITDIRVCKDIFEVINILQQMLVEVLSDLSLFENIIGDPTKFHEPILISEFDTKCTKVLREIKNDDGSYLNDVLDELTKAIPYDKMKGTVNKTAMAGKTGEDNINKINETINNTVVTISNNLKWFAKYASMIRKDLGAVVGELIKQTSGIDPEKDDKAFKNEINSTIKGKGSYEKDSEGKIKSK